MKASTYRPFSDLKSWNWQNVVIFALMAFYLTNFGYRVATQKFPYYGQDYLAFWSAGKVADTTGYSRIYDLQALRVVEGQVLKDLGVISQADDSSFLTLPALYLPVFLVPFQLLSRFQIQTSFAIWLIVNFLFLIGYLIFYVKTLLMNIEIDKGWIMPLALVLFSYPVFDNFLEGQINVFLMICVGECIRNAVKGRSLASGVWLGGLLLKPQLLILVIPVILFLKNWKVFSGFLTSSAFVALSSWLLSGSQGFRQLFTLLTKYSAGMATSSPQYMINWRMVGINLNAWTHSNIEWIVMAVGMLATLGILIYMIKDRPVLGSDAWVMSITGVFSATLAFTWHVHNHTAMIMVPLLIFAVLRRSLPIKTIKSWVLVPTGAWLGAVFIMIVISILTQISVEWLLGYSIAVSGFLANQILLFSILFSKKKYFQCHDTDN